MPTRELRRHPLAQPHGGLGRPRPSTADGVLDLRRDRFGKNAAEDAALDRDFGHRPVAKAGRGHPARAGAPAEAVPFVLSPCPSNGLGPLVQNVSGSVQRLEIDSVRFHGSPQSFSDGLALDAFWMLSTLDHGPGGFHKFDTQFTRRVQPTNTNYPRRTSPL